MPSITTLVWAAQLLMQDLLSVGAISFSSQTVGNRQSEVFGRWSARFLVCVPPWSHGSRRSGVKTSDWASCVGLRQWGHISPLRRFGPYHPFGRGCCEGSGELSVDDGLTQRNAGTIAHPKRFMRGRLWMTSDDNQGDMARTDAKGIPRC